MDQVNLPSKKVTSRSLSPRSRRERELAPAEAGESLELAEYDPTVAASGAEPSTAQRTVAGIVQLALFAAILAGGYFLAAMIADSGPTAERKGGARVARLVEVVEARPATQGPVIEAWGEVVAAESLIVRPELSGTINWVHPEVTAGGRLSAGEVVVRMDDRDLRLALLQAEAEIADIEARIQIEEGQAALGERELTRLSRNITEAQRNLVLRKPQMAQLKAELSAAMAVRDQARNALGRTEVAVPFDAIVIAEDVAPGAMISQGAEVATLVAADRFHIALALPAASVGWIETEDALPVLLMQPGIWPNGARREGRIVRLNSAVSGPGRMAELIVAVTDPLAERDPGLPRLLLGSFAQAQIVGKPIADAVSLSRAHLRDGDTVWVMGKDDMLEIRSVEIAWRGVENVLVTAGLEPGDRIVTTLLARHAPGMALRTRKGDAE